MKVRQIVGWILFAGILVLAGCSTRSNNSQDLGALEVTRTIESTEGVIETTETFGAVESETEISTERETLEVVDWGDEKDILGAYRIKDYKPEFSPVLDVELSLIYVEFYDRYWFTLIHKGWVVTGQYTYEDGELTLYMEDHETNTIPKLVFASNSDRLFCLDTEKSTPFSEISCIEFSDEIKENFTFMLVEEIIPDIIKESESVQIDYSAYDIVDFGDTSQLIGTYCATVDTEAADVAANTLVISGNNEEGYRFKLYGAYEGIETVGDVDYDSGIVTLSFEDYDKNFNRVNLRKLYFFTDELGQLLFLKNESTDFVKYNLGVSWEMWDGFAYKKS